MPSNKKQMFVVIEKFAQCNEIEFSGDCEDQSILIGSDNTHSVQFQLQWSNDHYIVYLILKPENGKRIKIQRNKNHRLLRRYEMCRMLFNFSERFIIFIGYMRKEIIQTRQNYKYDGNSGFVCRTQNNKNFRLS